MKQPALFPALTAGTPSKIVWRQPRQLSQRQEKVLEYFRAYRDDHGHSPTYKTAAAALGLTYSATVREGTCLKELGYL